MKKILRVLFVFLIGFSMFPSIITSQTKIKNKTITCCRGCIIEAHDNDKNFVATLENICKKIFDGNVYEREDTIHVFFINFETKNFFRFDRDTKNIYQFNWYSDFPFDKERVLKSINDPEIIINLKNPSKKSIDCCKYKYSYYIDFLLEFACLKRIVLADKSAYFSEIDLNTNDDSLYAVQKIYIGLKIIIDQRYFNRLIIFSI